MDDHGKGGVHPGGAELFGLGDGKDALLEVAWEREAFGDVCHFLRWRWTSNEPAIFRNNEAQGRSFRFFESCALVERGGSFFMEGRERSGL